MRHIRACAVLVLPIVIGMVGTSLVTSLLSIPWFFRLVIAVSSTVILFHIISSWDERIWVRSTIREREGEGRSSFVKSSVDVGFSQRVANATYDSLRAYWPRTIEFPLRLTDQLEEDLHVDPDDTDLIAKDIAVRCGVEPDRCCADPGFDAVATVEDVMRMVERCFRNPRG